MKKIIHTLKQKKLIPLDEFINIALYDKRAGYYSKKNPFGKKGDFITSPLVSNLFGEMIAIWCVAYWEYLNKPRKILLVELGPGDGSLCKTILNSLKKFQEFYNCLEVSLLEISSKFKKIQKRNISNEKVKWIDNIDQIKYGPIIFLGNEFFDSLPIKQFYRKKNLFFEKHVTLLKNKKNLRFTFKKAKKHLTNRLLNLNLISSGTTIEYPIDTIKYLNQIMKKINLFNGGILIFDYGYIHSVNQNTLQAVKKHRYANPLLNIGNSDISSHVNFGLLSKIFKKNNFNVEKIVTQSEFLQKVGINERANIISKKMNFREKANLYYKLKKLLDMKEMGKLFKVLFAQNNNGNFSIGF